MDEGVKRAIASRSRYRLLLLDTRVVHEVIVMPMGESDMTACGERTTALFKQLGPRKDINNFQVTKDSVTCLACIAGASELDALLERGHGR